jgi:hypothetical protein
MSMAVFPIAAAIAIAVCTQTASPLSAFLAAVSAMSQPAAISFWVYHPRCLANSILTASGFLNLMYIPLRTSFRCRLSVLGQCRGR